MLGATTTTIKVPIQLLLPLDYQLFMIEPNYFPSSLFIYIPEMHLPICLTLLR